MTRDSTSTLICTWCALTATSILTLGHAQCVHGAEPNVNSPTSIRIPAQNVQIDGGIAGVAFIENFETAFAYGVGCNQNEWQGACFFDTPANVGFKIVDDPTESFGFFSAQHTSFGDGQSRFGIESPIFAEQFGIVEADVYITDTLSPYQFVTVNFDVNFVNTRVQFESDGTITALQSTDCVVGELLPTTGSWEPNVVTRIGIEVPGDGSVNVYQDGSLIFTGTDIASQCAKTLRGINQILVFSHNVSGIATSTFVMDNIGSECLLDLPCPCYADIEPVGGDGTVNVDDLLVLIGSWGLTGPPRPRGDTFPLPKGNCLVNVDDILSLIGQWGPCAIALGACCLDDSTCLDLVSRDECADLFGNWNGCNSLCVNQTCLVVTPQDECDQPFPVFDGINVVSNAGATRSVAPGGDCLSTGSPDFNSDVWCSYIASCSGYITVRTCGTTGGVTDTVLAVYEGPCNSLFEIACADDTCIGAGITQYETLTAPVTQGEEYFIRVGSWRNTPTGDITIEISCTNNDDCIVAAQLDIGESAFGTLAGATQDDSPSCDGVPTGLGRWYTVVGDGSELTASLCNSPDEPWNAQLSVYCDCSCLTPVCIAGADDDTCATNKESITWCSEDGATYLILVHTQNDPAPDGNYILDLTAGALCGDPPVCDAPNDFCTDAIDITANIDGPFVVGDNRRATPKRNDGGPGDPEFPAGTPSCHFAGLPTETHNTVWYKFTAPTGVIAITVRLCDSTAPFEDSVMAAFTGECGSLTEVACGEDDCGASGWLSELTIENPIPDQLYYIIVANPGFLDDSMPGEFVLDITSSTPLPPRNDECVGAFPAFDGNNFINNIGATDSVFPLVACPTISEDNFRTDVWYTYTPTCTGMATISTCLSTAVFDTVLAVYSGTCATTSLLGCRDDACVALSEVTVPVTLDEPILIRVGMYRNSAPGNIVLSINCAPSFKRK